MKITEITLGIGGGGGVENLVRDLSLSFAKAGNQVTVGASRISLPGLDIRENSRGQWNGLRIARIKKYNLPVASIKSFTSNGLKMLGGSPSDVIHAHSLPSPGYLGRELKTRTGTPLVVTLHGGEVNILSKRPVFKALNRTVLGDADAVVAVSKPLAMATKEVLGVKAQIIQNGVDTKRFYPSGAKKDLDIVYAGMLRPEKGLDVLLDALEALGPEVRVGLAGTGPLEAWVRQEISRRRLGRRVQMLGLVGNDAMPGLLNRAKVFVLPSLSEGMSISLLEAMSCGTVPIVTDVGGNREVVRGGRDGSVVAASDPESLAEAVSNMLLDKPDHLKMSRSARERVVKCYGLERTVGSYMELFEGLAK